MPTRDAQGRRYQPRRVAPPTEAQVMAIADAMPWRSLRALYLCMAYSGLRISEACALNVGDVAADGTVTVRNGKGRTERQVDYSVLFEPGLSAVQGQMDRSGLNPWDPMFENFDGGRYSRNAAWRHFRSVADRLGLQQAVQHDLRAFHASWLINRGASDIDVAVQLRHVDKWGRPNTRLVRERYAFVELERSLDRIRTIGRTPQEGSHGITAERSSDA